MKALLWDKLDHNENEISQKGKGREKNANAVNEV